MQSSQDVADATVDGAVSQRGISAELAGSVSASDRIVLAARESEAVELATGGEGR